MAGRRMVVALLAVAWLAGCADPSPAVVPDPPAAAALPLASEADWRQGIHVTLPAGPSSVALLLDVPAEAWQPTQLVDGTDPLWYLPLAVSIRGLDAWDEVGEQPRVGVMAFRVVDGVVSLGSRWNPNEPIQDDTPVTFSDDSPCRPDAMQYLVAFLLDGRLPANASVQASVFAGGLGEEPPAGTVEVRPDLVGGEPLVASYDQAGNEKRARGWEVADGRTGVPAPVQPIGASVGTVLAQVAPASGPPGLYGYWLTRAALGTEGGTWAVEVSADGAVVSSTSYPVTGGLTSLTWIHGLGPVGSTWALSVELTSATPEPALYSLQAMRAPLDLASAGLRVEPDETMARWHEVYPAVLVDPALCG